MYCVFAFGNFSDRQINSSMRMFFPYVVAYIFVAASDCSTCSACAQNPFEHIGYGRPSRYTDHVPRGRLVAIPEHRRMNMSRLKRYGEQDNMAVREQYKALLYQVRDEKRSRSHQDEIARSHMGKKSLKDRKALVPRTRLESKSNMGIDGIQRRQMEIDNELGFRESDIERQEALLSRDDLPASIVSRTHAQVPLAELSAQSANFVEMTQPRMERAPVARSVVTPVVQIPKQYRTRTTVVEEFIIPTTVMEAKTHLHANTVPVIYP